jgi:hypothetical protein
MLAMEENLDPNAKEPLAEYSQPLDFTKVWLMFQETDKQFKETDKQFKETDRKFQETDKKIKALANLFTTQWGKLVEALVEPSCLRLFKERGIMIEQSMRNVKVRHGNEGMECDVVLVNGTELVVVEVKTTCRVEDVREFAQKLKGFKKFFKQYSAYKVYGALAAIQYDAEADKLAYRQGLFVLKSSGQGLIEIANDEAFVPMAFEVL